MQNEGFGLTLITSRLGSLGEKEESEANAACHNIADGFAGHFDRRLRHFKGTAKPLR
jgi:hypothetical protein